MKRTHLHTSFLIIMTCNMDWVLAHNVHLGASNGFDKAARICAVNGSHLMPLDSLQKYLLHHCLAGHNMSYWLPLVKENLQTWRTLGGIHYAGHIVDERQRMDGEECAIIHTSDRMLDSSSCNIPLEGHICKLSNSTPCPLEAECFETGNRKYGLFNKGFSWMAAFSDCQERNATLADFEASSAKDFMDTIHAKTVTHGRYAIGIIKAIWKHTSHSSEGALLGYQWERDEPKPGKSCAVLRPESLRWRSASCSEKHHYVCNPVDNIHQHHNANSSQTRMTSERKRNPSERKENMETKDSGTLPVNMSKNILIANTLMLAIMMVIGTALCIFHERRMRSLMNDWPHYKHKRHKPESVYGVKRKTERGKTVKKCYQSHPAKELEIKHNEDESRMSHYHEPENCTKEDECCELPHNQAILHEDEKIHSLTVVETRSEDSKADNNRTLASLYKESEASGQNQCEGAGQTQPLI